MMDGSTKAVEHCFFASCNDSEKVVAQDKAFGFPAAQRSTLDLFNKGAFQKRWLVFPINVEQQHWVFLESLIYWIYTNHKKKNSLLTFCMILEGQQLIWKT
jgi:hypothetical protein